MELLEEILAKENLNKAYKKVYQNKGVAGVDGITVEEIAEYIRENKDRIINKIRKRQYKPQPVKRVQIPKENGQKRNLGIPTVMDRIIQQAIVQVLTPIYEKQFHENLTQRRMPLHSQNSFSSIPAGNRPSTGTEQRRCVDIDVKSL